MDGTESYSAEQSEKAFNILKNWLAQSYATTWDGKRRQCLGCYHAWPKDDPEIHAADCVVNQARELLQEIGWGWHEEGG